MSDRTSAADHGPREREASPLVKFLIDFGPLVAFFAVYSGVERFAPGTGIYWATGVLMVATVAALAASRLLLGRFSMPPLVGAVLVVIFGGLTLWLQDPVFVMLKPTIINLLFAGVLAAGLLMGRPLLKLVMEQAFQLTDEGWHKLTVRWMLFFLSMAALNEIVWRNFSQPTWVAFKVWGILPLTVAFALAQIGLIRRYGKLDA
jgi:intracellular septation protein